jgi:hypothetical protein
VVKTVEALKGRTFIRVQALALGTTFLLVCALTALVLELQIVTTVATFIDQTVLSKLESESGQERGTWNQTAWTNFLETYGLGTGLGSARASSFVLVVLSNVGVLGAVLFGGFLWSVLRLSPRTTEVGFASRHAIAAYLIGASVSGTVFDLGALFYAFAALAAADSHWPQRIVTNRNEATATLTTGDVAPCPEV